MPNYGDPKYWDERYKNQNKTTFDWLENYETLRPLLVNLLDKTHRILNIGCGNGEITEDMYLEGYTQLVNMDISPVVIQQMKERNKDKPGMVWEVGDALDMTYEDESFDVVLDKSRKLLNRHPRCDSLREAFILQCSHDDQRSPARAEDWRNLLSDLIWKPTISHDSLCRRCFTRKELTWALK